MNIDILCKPAPGRTSWVGRLKCESLLLARRKSRSRDHTWRVPGRSDARPVTDEDLDSAHVLEPPRARRPLGRRRAVGSAAEGAVGGGGEGHGRPHHLHEGAARTKPEERRYWLLVDCTQSLSFSSTVSERLERARSTAARDMGVHAAVYLAHSSLARGRASRSLQSLNY